MGYSRTDYYERIIQRHIRSGRACNKGGVIHQALALLDAVIQVHGPEGRQLPQREGTGSPPVAGRPCHAHDRGTPSAHLRDSEAVNWRQEPERFFRMD